MKVAIVGTRTFSDYIHFLNAIKSIFTLREIKPTQIISGGAPGTDSLAKVYAEEYNIELVEFLPDWEKHGKAAGPIRNKLIVSEADIVIAFWDGVSKGTLSSIHLATSMQKPIVIIKI